MTLTIKMLSPCLRRLSLVTRVADRRGSFRRAIELAGEIIFRVTATYRIGCSAIVTSRNCFHTINFNTVVAIGFCGKKERRGRSGKLTEIYL